MKICLASGYKYNPDEGMKIFALQMYKELSNHHHVIHINIRDNLFNKSFWFELKKFNPDVIHFFLRPGLVTLGLAKIAKIYCQDAKLVISALQPPLNRSLIQYWIPLLKPDLMLIQSDETEDVLNSYGCKTIFLPSGVDTTKFTQADNDLKERLRKKYNIGKKKFVLLHVGHINRGRNLKVFKAINQNNRDLEIIIVGSPNTFNFDNDIYLELKANMCNIWRDYLENIEEVYQIADCYVFPTKDKSYAIEIPLSILEAMACNLPIITTNFGGLSRIFKEENGFFFMKDEDDIGNKLENLRNNDLEIKTRDMVLFLSWYNIAQNLSNIYENLVHNKGDKK